MNRAKVEMSGRKWYGASCGGIAGEGQVRERGRARVVCWGRCMSRRRWEEVDGMDEDADLGALEEAEGGGMSSKSEGIS
jgi:hypothetical protein